MGKMRSYLVSRFYQSFFVLFLPLFFIVSLVYFVKIASLTSKISLTFMELLEFYAYTVPDIIFYTLPLSFVAATANSISALSQNYTLISLHAMGISSSKIVRFFIPSAILFSLLLLSISFFVMPTAKQLLASLKYEKSKNAILNISAGRLGQKFNNFYIYAKDGSSSDLKNIVIYSRVKDSKEQFFAAKSGGVREKESLPSLFLKNGYGYTYENRNLKEVRYKMLELFENANAKQISFQSIREYWAQAKSDKRRLGRVLFFLFVSLIPLLGIYPSAAFSMKNPRYEQTHAFWVTLLSLLLFYIVASQLEKRAIMTLFVLVLISSFGVGIWLFKQKVARFF